MDKKSEFPINILVNPLRFSSIDDEFTQVVEKDVDYYKLLMEMQEPIEDKSIIDICGRYKRLTDLEGNLSLIPVNKTILSKLIFPLRNAKQSFCLGNYLGCIALCGTVSEMIVIFLFDISKISINQKKLDDDLQKKIFGRTFERLGQEQRLKILEAYGIIDKSFIDDADKIRNNRNKYLHILTQDLENLEEDAVLVYKSVTVMLEKIISLRVKETGKIAVPSHLVEFLSKSVDVLENRKKVDK